jgi:two-component system phosphate regulon response regulator PhoB
MGQHTVAVLEDDRDILDVTVYNLEREGYVVRGYTDGAEGLEAIREDLPDLVLLDLMLPGLDGLQVCQRLRSDPRTKHLPVIMVTAKTEESDVVLGLGIGADDYVCKPFSPRELVARIKALLRRNRGSATEGEPEQVVKREGLEVDAVRHKVLVDERRVDLTATEFRLLYFLASHPGRVFNRDQIMYHVLGEDAIVIDRNVDVHIRAIRKKIEPYRHLIETVRGVGYRFSEG